MICQVYLYFFWGEPLKLNSTFSSRESSSLRYKVGYLTLYPLHWPLTKALEQEMNAGQGSAGLEKRDKAWANRFFKRLVFPPQIPQIWIDTPELNKHEQWSVLLFLFPTEELRLL